MHISHVCVTVHNGSYFTHGHFFLNPTGTNRTRDTVLTGQTAGVSESVLHTHTHTHSDFQLVIAVFVRTTQITHLALFTVSLVVC